MSDLIKVHSHVLNDGAREVARFAHECLVGVCRVEGERTIVSPGFRVVGQGLEVVERLVAHLNDNGKLFGLWFTLCKGRP